MTETTDTSAALFAGKDEIVRAIYTRLLEALRTLGPVQEELHSPGAFQRICGCASTQELSVSESAYGFSD